MNSASLAVGLTSARKTLATAYSACSGHGWNQSMVVLLTRPGKFRQRICSCWPVGDIQSTTCRF